MFFHGKKYNFKALYEGFRNLKSIKYYQISLSTDFHSASVTSSFFKTKGARSIQPKFPENFGPKLNGSVRSNRKSFEKTGPPFEVVLFSRLDRLEFWLNGSRPRLEVVGRTNVRLGVPYPHCLLVTSLHKVKL